MCACGASGAECGCGISTSQYQYCTLRVADDVMIYALLDVP